MSTPPVPASPVRGLDSIQCLAASHLSGCRHLSWVRVASRLNDADCDAVIAAGRSFPVSSSETVGEAYRPGLRSSEPRKLGYTDRTAWIFRLVCDVAAAATRQHFGLELSAIERSPQYVEYRPGLGHFAWHNDYSHERDQAPRKVTIIIQLSQPEDYEGGRLQAFEEEAVDLPVERGSILAFPSTLPHQVTPVVRGVRRALVAWIAGPRLR